MTRALIDRAFNKSAFTYEEHAQVQHRVADHLLSLLDSSSLVSCVLDVGCGVGLQGDSLKKLYPEAKLHLIDRAENMCCQAKKHCPDATVLQADAGDLPIESGSVDLIFSSSMLQWVDSVEQVLSEWVRVLKPGGVAAISCFLEGSLLELHQSHMHVNTLPSFAALIQAISLLPVSLVHQSCDTEIEWFHSMQDVVKHLRGVGAHTVTDPHHSKGLLTPNRWRRMCERYQEYQQGNGLLPLTYEVGYVVIEKH